MVCIDVIVQAYESGARPASLHHCASCSTRSPWPSAQLPARGRALRGVPAVAQRAAGPAGIGAGRAPLRARPPARAADPGGRGRGRPRPAPADRGGRPGGRGPRASPIRCAGTLRLGVIPTISPYLLAALVPALRRAHPGLTSRWTEDKTDLLVRARRSGALDGALLALEADLGDLAREPVGRDPFVLATPRGHALARRSARPSWASSRRRRAAARRWTLPARSGAGGLRARAHARARLPGDQPLDAGADGGGWRGRHAAARSWRWPPRAETPRWRSGRWPTRAPSGRSGSAGAGPHRSPRR